MSKPFLNVKGKKEKFKVVLSWSIAILPNNFSSFYTNHCLIARQQLYYSLLKISTVV